MTLLEDLNYYQSRRRFPNWEPKPASTIFKPKGTPEEEVLYRCVSFLPLELQVAEWDHQAASSFERIGSLLGSDKSEVIAILERNAKDEDKHDQVLKYLARYLGQPNDNIATELVERWQALTDPITATYALEMGVFFSILPTLLTCGDVYAATVAQWISDDERVHVETGLRLMKHFGLKLDKPTIQLVFDTNYHIFEPLGQDKAIAQAKRAVQRLLTGKDKEMLKESLPVTIAFFEQHNNGAIVY